MKTETTQTGVHSDHESLKPLNWKTGLKIILSAENFGTTPWKKYEALQNEDKAGKVNWNHSNRSDKVNLIQ